MTRQWYVRSVLHEDIAGYLQLGWMFAQTCIHPTCSDWAVLMAWPCACKMVEPA